MKNWSSVALGDIFDIARGGSPRPIQSFITSDSDGINWIMIGDASDNSRYITSTKKRIIKSGVSKSRMVNPGDFLLTNSMSFGHPYILKTSGCIHDGWLVLSAKKNNIDQNYFYHLLGSNTVYREFSRRAAGTTVKNLNIDLVRGLKVSLPPLEEQKRIAAILDKADAIRRKRKEAIALTEELLRSTFLDMFGDPVGRNKQWKEHNLSDFVSIVSGQVDPQTKPYMDMPHIGGDNIESNTGFIHKVRTPRELKLISGKYLFEPADILYSKIRPYLNKVSIPGFVGVCSADIYPLRINESIIDREYLVYLLRSSEFLSYAEKHSARTNIPKINRPALLKFSSRLPPLELQKKFSQIYRNVYDTKNNLNSSIKESENLFNSLLQKAFRGEL